MSRRLVAVLFLDLVGWTELAERLDPEPLQEFLERYYDICVTAIEQHGGIVEKFIGDAIMAVFGAERSEEDDALRAVRTSFQARSAISDLAVEGFTVQHPQVHAGIAAGRALVTQSRRAGIRIVGDVVNLAARLQSAAPPDEIFINEVAAQLVRGHVSIEAVEPLTLKGKQEPVPTWRAVGLTTGVASSDTPNGLRMVNRHAELDRILDAGRTLIETRCLQTVTILGPPGIGKSRLVREAIRRIRSEQPDVGVAWGACSPNDVTWSYGALAEVLADLDIGQWSPGTAQPQLQRAHQVLSLITRSPDGAAAEGTDDAIRPGVEEIVWATKEFLAARARRPLILVWDDLQWARPALLELIDELASGLQDYPLMLVCLHRPEHGDWQGPQSGVHLRVGPLNNADTFDLVRSLATRLDSAEVTAQGLDLVDRIVTASGGSPLFAELMIETVALGHPLGKMPPTVTALVSAMLDRLSDDARRILEAAAVIGTTFSTERLGQLGVPVPAAGVTQLLAHQLIEPDGGTGRYRFSQQPVQEVAYSRLTKQDRLGWHRLLADNGVAPALNLERAVRLMLDLRPNDSDLVVLRHRAAAALVDEGTQALRQRDLPTATDLLTRAFELSPTGPSDIRALAAIRLSDSLFLGGELRRAAATVAEIADELPDSPAGTACRAQQLLLVTRLGEDTTTEVEDLATVLEQSPNDDLSWCRFYQLRMFQNVANGRFWDAEQAALKSIAHSRAFEDSYEHDRMLVAHCEIGQWSPTPIPDKLRVCRQLLERLATDRFLLLPVLAAQARYLALTDDIHGACQSLDQVRQIISDLRLTMGETLVAQVSGVVSSLAGQREQAQQHFIHAAERLTATGQQRAALTMRVLAIRERVHVDGESPELDRDIQALAAKHDQMDMRTQPLCLALAARTAATRADVTGKAEAAQRLLEMMDDPVAKGDTYAELAVAYRQMGNTIGSRTMIEAGSHSYSLVGATLPMRRLGTWA